MSASRCCSCRVLLTAHLRRSATARCGRGRRAAPKPAGASARSTAAPAASCSRRASPAALQRTRAALQCSALMSLFWIGIRSGPTRAVQALRRSFAAQIADHGICTTKVRTASRVEPWPVGPAVDWVDEQVYVHRAVKVVRLLPVKRPMRTLQLCPAQHIDVLMGLTSM